MKQKKPCGYWPSEITADLITQKLSKFSSIYIEDEDVYISELRPFEKGRVTVLKLDNKNFNEVIPQEFNVRSTVHEYGGRSFCVKNKNIYFSNFVDQQVYKKDSQGNIEAITNDKASRFIDYIVDDEKKVVFCVREKHFSNKVDNEIVKIDKDKNIKILVSGRDFYGCLALNKDKTKLAFIAWNHPNMPWDNTDLYVADVDKKADLKNITKIANLKNQSILNLSWDKEGILYFVSDQNLYWNIYKYKEGLIENICPMEAELAMPFWVFGLNSYDFYYENNKTFIVAICNKDSEQSLILIEPLKKTKKTIKTPFNYFADMKVLDDKIFFIGSSLEQLACVAFVDLKTYQTHILKKNFDKEIDPENISKAQKITFLSVNNEKAYMLFYPPTNKNFKPLDNEKPYLIVKSHGGPTAQAFPFLDLEIQYWTSRGFAFADVNYSGSTGFGRNYRHKLYGQWGYLDVQDCKNAALFLVKQGLVDPNRLIIKGSSAGGFTTLCALTFENTFKAGACYYGVSDLFSLLEDTHKFEKEYLQKLVGEYLKYKNRYYERSPINFIDKLSCPIIFFQGLKDKVVPPSQSEKMYLALKRKALLTAYITFENEAHGFKDSKNIKKALEEELSFYQKVFNFSK